MTAGVIIFSRMSSSRLPGKALKPLGGMPLIERVLKRASFLDLPVILATSDQPEDDVLAEFVLSIGFQVYRGSLNNVLERAVLAAEAFQWDVFYRICGDRPFFDLEELMDFKKKYIDSFETPNFDLITNYSEQLPKGLTNELINVSTLRKIHKQSNINDSHKEHLTQYFYDFKSDFKIIKTNSPFESNNTICLAVDTLSDYQIMSKVCDYDNDINLFTKKALILIKEQLKN